MSEIYMDIYWGFTPHTRLLVVSSYNYKKYKVITLLTGACLDLSLHHVCCHNEQTSKLLHDTA